MKKIPFYFCLSALAAVTFAYGLRAASKPPANTPSSTNSLSIRASEAEIFETTNGFRVSRFWGGVTVIDPPSQPGEPETIMTSSNLTARWAAAGRQIDDIIAETNVVIIQGQYRATANKAIYRATNDVVELIGNAVLRSTNVTQWASRVILDRANRRFRAIADPGTQIVTQIESDAIGATNKSFFGLPAPDKKTNDPAPASGKP